MNRRPQINDIDIRLAASKKLLERIKPWLKDGGLTEEEISEQENQIITDLYQVLIYGADGYELAKKLEYKSWAVDSELVELLDSNPQLEICCLKTEEWIKQNNICPKFSEGQIVEFKYHNIYLKGVINSIDLKLGIYQIVEDKTHGSYFVPFEDDIKPIDIII